ncbi:replicative helicase loader/inhibitor [Robinsoniella peoriensis]
MEYREFMVIASTIKSAYPEVKVMGTEESIEVWFAMLNDLEYTTLSKAVSKYIKKSRYTPTIADLRAAYRNEIVQEWSIDWKMLLDGARIYELTEGGQYALKILTRDYVDYCINGNPAKTNACMKDFERLYNDYYAKNIKQQLDNAGILGSVIETGKYLSGRNVV